MSGRYTHIKEFVDWMGEDLRSSDILRPKGFSKGSKNCLHSPQGAAMQRPGSKFVQSGYGRFGITTFETTSIAGVNKKEIIGFGASTAVGSSVPWRLVKSTFTLTNSHATDAATVSMVYVEATTDFRFSITRSAASLCNIDLGIGTESVPYYLSDLDTAVSALTSFAMTAPTNGSTTPAAYMELLDAQTVAANGGTLTVSYWYWEEIWSTRPYYEFSATDVSIANNTIATEFFGLEINPFREEQPVKIFGTSTLPTGLTAGTQYYIKDATPGLVKLSLTAGGAAIDITGVGAGRMFLRGDYSNQIGYQHYAEEFGTMEFTNVSTVNLNNVLYCGAKQRADSSELGAFSGGQDLKRIHIGKYDGQRFYRAGIMGGTVIFSAADIAAASKTDHKGTFVRTGFSGTDLQYRSYLKFVDKAGNVIEGTNTTDQTAVVSPATEIVQLSMVTIPSVISSLGFNTAGAVTTAAGSSTLTYAVDDGFGNDQGLKVGDIGYFWCARQLRFIQREVVTASATSITFDSKSLDQDSTSTTYDDGQAPSINDEAQISANLRIVIMVTGASGYQHLTEIPFSILYQDYYVDDGDEAGDEVVEQIISHDLPPPSQFVTSFNTHLMLFGDETNRRLCHFSDIESPEYVPAVTNNFALPQDMTAGKQSGDVFVAWGERKYIGTVSGDLTSFAFRVDQIADNIGTFNQDGVQQIDESTLFFPTHKGPYVLSNGRDLVPLGAVKYPDGKVASRIEPFFTRLYNATEEQPLWARVTATVIQKDSLYVLHIPFEDPAKPGFATSNSVTWVFDFGRGTWWPWYGLNMAGGAAVMDDVVYWTSRIHDAQAGADNDNITCRLSQQQRLKGKYNYADHDQYINWIFPMHWENLGDPGLFKRFLRARLFSHETRLAASSAVTLKAYVDYSAANLAYTNALTWASQLELKPKLKAEICRAMMLEISSTAYFQPFPLSGLEIEATANFRQEMKD